MVGLIKNCGISTLELAALATRLREIGISDTVSSNSASDTAALNAEAIAVSDSIDDIVSTAKFHDLAILSTSARTSCYSQRCGREILRQSKLQRV